MSLEIKTNNQPRPILHWYDLPHNVQVKEFDWVDESIQDDMTFVMYKGNFICLDDYMRISNDAPAQWREGGWQGYHGDGFFCGTLIKYTDDCESVIIATYLS